MGKLYAALLPLDQETVLIMSVRNQEAPMRLFGKRPEWPGPKLLCQIPPGEAAKLGSVRVQYVRAVPASGLQYKCDPAIAITYIAFAFIISGVLLAAVPHRHVWAAAGKDDDGQSIVALGGRSVKARVGFERSMEKLIESIRKTLPDEKAETI